MAHVARCGWGVYYASGSGDTFPSVAEGLPKMAKVHVFPDLQALSAAAAEALAAVAREAVSEQGRFTLALAGGSTPRGLYEALATGYRDSFAWSALHVFWGDERFVSPDEPASNQRMAREALLSRVPVPPSQVHPFPTALPDARAAAAAYETELRLVFTGDWPRFDLILLGLGDDGHTASLFPGSPAIAESQRWVTLGEAPTQPRTRLTLTLPVLNHAARVWFLVSGASKREALRRALSRAEPLAACPAAGVQPTDGELVWWVDQAAVGDSLHSLEVS